MKANARRSQLRAFLRERRARLLPQDVCLPAGRRRRVPGLRAEDVAELAGVSTKWYTLFEQGNTDRRFSLEFVQRVADALRLEGRDRATLLRLALPEVAAATECVERSAADGALHHLAKIRTFSRRLAAASSFEEAVTTAVETIQDVIATDCVTVANLERGQGAPSTIAVGPRASFVAPSLAPTVLDMNEPARFGNMVICENAPIPREARRHPAHPIRIRGADGAEIHGIHNPRIDGYCEFNGRLRERSGLVVGLFERGVFRGNLVAFWSEPRRHSEVEIDAIETVRAILELSTGGLSIHRN